MAHCPRKDCNYSTAALSCDEAMMELWEHYKVAHLDDAERTSETETAAAGLSH